MTTIKTGVLYVDSTTPFIPVMQSEKWHFLTHVAENDVVKGWLYGAGVIKYMAIGMETFSKCFVQLNECDAADAVLKLSALTKDAYTTVTDGLIALQRVNLGNHQPSTRDQS